MNYYYTNTFVHTSVKTGERSRKLNGIYTSNNPYRKYERRTQLERSFHGTLIANPFYEGNPYITPSIQLPAVLQNRLYDKLRETLIGSKGELLTSVVEWRTSLDMISKRALQLWAAYSAVRKYQFKKAARILKTSVPKKISSIGHIGKKDKTLSPTELWLEYWMGWAPLAGDIGLAINKLTGNPTESKHFSVGVSDRNVKSKIYGRGSGSLSSNQVVWSYWREHFSVTRRFTAYGDVIVTNHNYQLANQLGFTNPALTMWQILPFSFMVDWFANVGKVLGTLTDFHGLSFSNTGAGILAEGNGTFEYSLVKSSPGRSPTTGQFYPVDSVSGSYSGYVEEMRRVPGALPGPKLQVVMLDKLSLTRAATSVSLLVEIFLRK